VLYSSATATVRKKSTRC